MNSESESSTDVEQFLTFRLGEQDFGVPITLVQGIQGWDKVTQIPETPAHVLGVIDLRGTVVPIIDLRRRLGFKRCDFNTTTVVIVIKVIADGADRTFGLVVDAVSEVCDVAPDERKSSPDFGGGIKAQYMLGLATTDDRMIILLDLDRLMSATDFDEIEVDEDTIEEVIAATAVNEEETTMEKSAPDIEAIEQSFALLAPRAEELVARFYEELFDRYPAVMPMFADSNMAEQRKKLLAAIKLVVANLRSPEPLAKTLIGLGARHQEIGAEPAHYEAVAATLLDVLAEMAGEAWTPRFAAAWKRALELVAEGMLKGYSSQSATGTTG